MEKVYEKLEKEAEKIREVMGCNYDIFVQKDNSVICRFCEYDYGVVHYPEVLVPTCCEEAINEYKTSKTGGKDEQ